MKEEHTIAFDIPIHECTHLYAYWFDEHSHASTRRRIRTHLHAHTHTYVVTCTEMYTPAYVRTYMHFDTDTHIRRYIQTCIHACFYQCVSRVSYVSYNVAIYSQRWHGSTSLPIRKYNPCGFSRQSLAMLDPSLSSDFDIMSAPASQPGAPASAEKPKEQKKWEWLKVFETLPSQLLNVYGPSKFAKLSDKQVWTEMQEPLKSGAAWMSEMCSKEPERRGVGINRFIHAMKTFCEYQNDPGVKAANKAVLNPTMYEEFYKEVDLILPSLQYCLAPKKQHERKGAAALRASGMDAAVQPGTKTEAELDQHAKKVYEWLDKGKLSRVRMMAHWQSCGGLAFVAQCHHRAATCFRYHGNSFHGAGPAQLEVSLQEFQAAVKVRHALGHNGIDVESADSKASGVNDFGSITG